MFTECNTRYAIVHVRLHSSSQIYRDVVRKRLTGMYSGLVPILFKQSTFWRRSTLVTMVVLRDTHFRACVLFLG